jgi:acyl-CoA synthetase (AMP-forming)/AMP-acid ligase II
MIIRAGQNIFPAEIEAHLLNMPGVQNVSVVGVPDEMQGEAVWAFIQPQEGKTLSVPDVLAFCRGELAPYKVPGQVRFVKELEMTPTGKIKKFPLQEMAKKELESAAHPASA